MPTYFPTKKGGEAFPAPQSGGVVTSKRDGHDPVSAGSDEVLQRTSGTVNAWLAAQRQAYANSTLQYHSATLDHPEVEARYQNVQGTETYTVNPKPVVTTPDTPDEPTTSDSPNLLPVLALTEVVTPDTPLFLMVLYKQNRIAAIPMKTLASPSIAYAAEVVSPDSKGRINKWTPIDGDLIRIMQAKIGGTEFVMMPLDLSGEKAASHLYLSTNALGDAIETKGDPNNMPIFNGQAVDPLDPTAVYSIYSTGGGFSYSKKDGFRLTYTLATENDDSGPKTVVPYAIANDGTSYYLPTTTGDILMTLSQETSLTYYQSDYVDQLTVKAIQATQPPKITTYYPGVSLIGESHQKYSKGGYDSEFSLQYTTYYSGNMAEQTAYVVATSYYLSGAFGQIPELKNFTCVFETSDYQSYQGGEYGETIVTLYGLGIDASNTVPLMSFKLGDTFSIVKSDFSYTHDQISSLKLDMSKPAGRVNYQGEVSLGNVVHDDGNQFGRDTTGIDWSYVGVLDRSIPLPPPIGPSTNYDAGAAHDYCEAQLRSYLSLPYVTAFGSKAGTPLINNTDASTASASIFTSGDVNYTLASGPPDDPTTDGVISTGSSQGDNSSESYCYLHLPAVYGTISTVTHHATFKMFNDTLSYDYTYTAGSGGGGGGDGVGGGGVIGGGVAPRSPQLQVYAFPPMLDGQPFYVVSQPVGTDTDTNNTVVTPYERLPNVPATRPFVPWFHLSNGKDYMQGYYLDAQAVIRLNGDKSVNWITGLAKLLKCEPTEIAGMVMDITLEKIKAVAHVKPTDYSGSSVGDLGPPF